MKKLIAALAMAPIMASAAYYDGFNLLSELKENKDQGYQSTFYVMGVVDAVSGFLICPPPTVTGVQVGMMTRKWLAANPERLHEAAHHLIIENLGETWPCKKKGGKL